ncbi:MAG: hypothetical protein OXG16_13655 [Rhodospirillales bacterium]|nr:hypothetical protein [Rhodospirillales bacterium]
MALPEELGSLVISSTCWPANVGELPPPHAVSDCEIIRAMTGLAMGRMADCRRMESIERWALGRISVAERQPNYCLVWKVSRA